MIIIRFTTRRYADRLITLRTDADGYADRSGVYEDGAWTFRLDDAQLPPELGCKFVLDGRTWMEGYNLAIRAEAGREYSYAEGEVRFGLDIRFLTVRYADRRIVLRTWPEGQADVNGSYEDGAWRFHLDEPSGADLLRFAFVIDGRILMKDGPLAVQPEPGGAYVYSETDVRFGVDVRLVTRRYAERLVTMRTSADDWADVYGRYEEGAWTFELDAARHPPGTSFKFVLDGDTYMEGPDLTLPDAAGERIDFDEASMHFPSPPGATPAMAASAAMAAATAASAAGIGAPPAAVAAATPTISLTPPSATVTAGYPFVLGGELSNVGGFPDGRIAEVTGVTVYVDTGDQWPGSITDGGRTWRSRITIYATGAHMVRAEAPWEISYADGRANDTGTATPPPDPPQLWPWSRMLDVASPNPTVDASDELRRIGITVHDVSVRVQATVPVETVMCFVGGSASGTPLSNTFWDYWSGRITLPVTNPVPAGGVSVDVSVVARTAVGVGRAQWSVQVVDLTAPRVSWQMPGDRSRVEVFTPSGDSAAVVVGADVTDTFGAGGGFVSAGVAAGDVTCTVDGGAVTSLAQVRGADPVRWQGIVRVNGLGPHELVLHCQDQAGNATTQARTIVVVQAAVRDISRRSYLADLVEFTADRLAVGPGGRRVSAADLAVALSQPFHDLALGSEPGGEQPINAVRGRVEVLRGYLAGAPRAPAAHWPMGEGAGTIIRDETGGGSDGRLQGDGTWGPGRAGGFAVVLDGTGDFVDMGQAPQVAVSSAFTVTAWIRPEAPGPAEGGVIAGRESSFLVARLPDGRIRWALATPAPGWGWVDTDAVAPEGQWTHVAVRYDGARVRTSIDGVLAAEDAASGPITPVGADVDVRVGSRQSVADRYFAGSIADVRVYDVSLSDYELRRLLGEVGAAGEVWLDDDLPPGVVDEGGEGWTWTTADPAPRSGTRAHRSTGTVGPHRHGFGGAPGWLVHPGDRLFAWVYLDPGQLPRQVVLEWQDGADGTWSHRASWGDDAAASPPPGMPEPAHVGPLPAAGNWARLEVPAAMVGLERCVVTGLAFTLVDGQAWWDASGRTSAATLVAGSGYEAAAYSALLTALGTSLDEVRAVRGAPPDVRRALASRLAIALSPSRPDELDALLLAAPAEADLQDLFGLEQTTPGSPPSAGPPLLTIWRARRLREEWAREENTPSAAGARAVPIVDPDVVADADIVAGPAGDPARQLRSNRAAWVADRATELEALEGSEPDAAAGLAALLAAVFPAADLEQLAQQRWQGHDVTAQLDAAGLDPLGFDRLLTLRALAAQGPLTDAEWSDAVAILVAVLKRRRFDDWRTEERSLRLILDPGVFAVAAAPAPLPPWRAAWRDRRAWEERLTARTEQLAGQASSLQAAVAGAERIALPLLRGALLAAAAPTTATARRLSQALFLDLEVGSQLATTRVKQAAEAIQGLQQSVSSAGDVTDTSLPWVVVPPTDTGREAFFGELRWMENYAAWSSAMEVFYHPENALLPSARDAVSGAFAAHVRAAAPTTAAEARTAAHRYWVDLPTLAPVPTAVPTHASLPPHLAGQGTDRFPNTEELTRLQLDALARAERDVFAPFRPVTPLAAVPDGIREVFFDLPMQLAYDLALAGQWRSALDWLRTVYDYTQPAGQRAVFAGFALDKAPRAPLTRQNWLNGGNLDPWALTSTRPDCYLQFTVLLTARVLCDFADEEFTFDTAESRSRAARLYEQAIDVLAAPELVPADGIPANPQLEALTRRAKANRRKLRAGLNIGGLVRPLGDPVEGSAAGSAPVTNYRFPTLIARAQRLVASAAQTEASFLASLQQEDRERYDRLLAGQDLQLADARAQVARDQAELSLREVTIARSQSARARTQRETYQQWVSEGLNGYERTALIYYGLARSERLSAGDLQSEAGFWQGITSFAAGAFGGYGGAISGWGQYAASVPGGLAAVQAAASEAASIDASRSAALASWERRQQDWELAAALANLDMETTEEQIRLAQGRAAVAAEEAIAAELIQRNDRARLAFLETKFTNAELYAYMSGVLGGVYRYLLQRATAVARLAEQQLAFERQAPMPGSIKSTYWSPAAATVPAPDDTRGLTGSVRLMQDLTRLEEYAAETDRRKLQLTHTISFAAEYPVDLQRFRDTGVLPFATPLSLFESRMPGIFLATIRRVRVSLVALVPPTQGIRATLANGGTSRVVVAEEDGVFRSRTLHTASDTVALTSPVNATGVFDLDLQPDLLLPFEGAGVDTTWELRLPKAANPFDFKTIADIIIGIDYTALFSPDRAAEVTRRLPGRRSNSIAFSLRRDFVDGWYGLVSSAETQQQRSSSVPLTAVFPLAATDFPPNLTDLSVDAITLLVIRRPESSLAITVDHLYRDGPPADPALSTRATSVDGIVSTRSGSGASWLTLTGPTQRPDAIWELGIVADHAALTAIAQGELEDLVFNLSYTGSLPPWPA